MSDSVRSHRRQPTRLHRPWDSPGKNTGVGCHFLLQYMQVKSESEVAQSCPTPSNPMDCSPPGSPVHGILQARALEWGAIALVAAISNWTVHCEYCCLWWSAYGDEAYFLKGKTVFLVLLCVHRLLLFSLCTSSKWLPNELFQPWSLKKFSFSKSHMSGCYLRVFTGRLQRVQRCFKVKASTRGLILL